MEKRTLIAIVLSFAIIAAWPQIIKKLSPKTHTKLYEKQEQEQKQEIEPTITPSPALTPEIEQEAVSETLFTLNNGDLEVVFSDKGAAIKETALLKFTDKNKIPEKFTINEKQSNLLFTLEDVNLSKCVNKIFTKIQEDSNSITFQYVFPEQMAVIKKYTLSTNYTLNLEVTLKNTSASDISFFEGYKVNLMPGLGAYNKKDDGFFGTSVLLNQSDSKAKLFKKGLIKKLEPETLYQDAYWVGMYNKYFAFITRPLSPISNVYLTPIENTSQMRASIKRKSFNLAAGQSITDNYVTYIGPKDLSILKTYEFNFNKIINYGMFHVIGIFLLWLLKFFFSVFKNYGIAIMLLTITIKIILWPLTQKSFNSMKEMQKLTPHLKELREKYKNEPQRIQKETMALYKKHKVNPMGGCLPMILQMPIFFALFAVLQNAIELRQAPFFFWITDLSQKDPTYIMPIVMGATMFLQQKMSPTSMDPAQEKMMLIMPIVFTFLFVNFPSGLVLYWLMNNVLTIGHQYWLKKV